MELFESAAAARAAARAFADGKVAKSKWTEVVESAEPAPVAEPEAAARDLVETLRSSASFA